MSKKRKNQSSTLTDEVVWYKGQKYIDPLIKASINQSFYAYAREKVAECDAIASILTYGMAEAFFAEMPKFYESDELGSPEIMQDLRQFLKADKCEEIWKEAFRLFNIHGWLIGFPKIDPFTGRPTMELYSEYECPPEQIKRDMFNNITSYWIQTLPYISLDRQYGNIRQINRQFSREMVLHATRSTWNLGFGHSIFEGTWDAITKLREDSHMNAFKNKLIPWVRVPPDYSDPQINDLLEVLAKADTNVAMVQRAYEDANGEVTDLPQVSFATPAQATPPRSTAGGSPNISDLTAEWARLCGKTRRSVGYFTGGGAISASMAAAAQDSNDDLYYDIIDFNLFVSPFLIPFVKWYAGLIGYPIPETFTIKGWQQWSRDEALYQNQLQSQMELANSMAAETNQVPSEAKQNAGVKTLVLHKQIYCNVCKKSFRTVGYDSTATFGKYFCLRCGTSLRVDPIDYQPDDVQGRNNSIFEFILNDCNLTRQNLIPNLMQPVNSSSGNVQQVFLERLPNQTDKLYVKYKAPYDWYSYADTSLDMSAIGDSVKAQGGEAVWQYLRGADNAPKDANGEYPKGLPKKSFAKGGPKPTPLAGKPHDVYGSSYTPELTEPVSLEPKTTDEEGQPKAGADVIRERSEYMKEQEDTEPLHSKESTQAEGKKWGGFFGKLQSVWKTVKSIFKRNIGFAYEDIIPKEAFLHPLLQQYNSISGIRKNMRVGYDKAIQLVYGTRTEQVRSNLMAGATGFHVKNPYVYNLPEGLSVEYICPESVKKNVGKSVPFGIWHNLDDEESPELPDWQIIGTYKMNDFDGEKDISTIDYYPDWEAKAIQIFQKMHQMGFDSNRQVKNWMDHYIENVKKGMHGDISTAYTTDVRYDKQKQKTIQNNIDLLSVSAVPTGNCTKPYCQTNHLQD